MKPLPKVQSKWHLDDALTPMINVIFLLLIFFVIAGRIDGRDQSIQLPASQTEQSPAPTSITVDIRRDRSVWINGKAVDTSIADALNVAGVGPSSIVVCRVDRQLPAVVLDELLQAGKTLALKSLQIATVQPRQ